MKKFSKRVLTFVLACAMVFGLSGMTAFAAEADGQDAQNEIVTFADQSGYDRPAIDSEPDGTYREYEPDFQWYIDLGSEADSYEINTAEELAAFSAIVNDTDLPDNVRQNSFAGQTVTLGQDIVMNDPDNVKSEDGEWGGIGTPTLTVSEEAYAFTPIGNMRFNPDGSADTGYSFEGTFDGDGHTIENLFVFSGLEEDAYDGLFGVVGSENYAELEEKGDVEEGTTFGCLKDFTLTGLIWVRGGYYGEEIDFAGGVCAKLSAGASIEDVTNQARIYAPYTDNVGGIVGFAGTPHAMGGSSETGGGTDTYDPGYEENPSGYNTFVLRCANEGPVSAFHKNGGIVGENAATIKYCYNSGWVQCRRNYSGVRMGGIAGTNGNNGAPCEESVIAYCYNAGAVSNDGCDDLSKTHVSVGDYGVRGYAGITGSNYGGHGKNEIYNCYNIGAIPAGFRNYNSIASYLDDDGTYGSGAYVSIRNNYTLNPSDDIAINWGTSTEPQETGFFMTSEEFTSPDYGYAYNEETKEVEVTCLTGLGPYFVYDENGDNPKYEHFPILWWQVDKNAKQPTLTGLTIAQEPDKTTGYIRGDTFDPTGMVVIAEYDNGASALLMPDIDSYNGTWYTRTDGYHYQYEADSGEYMDGGATYVEITYTDGGNTVSAWQPVNGAKPSVSEVNITSDMDDNTKTYDGGEVTLTANAEVVPADAELTYQWYKDGDALDGETGEVLTLAGDVSDSGTYNCVVTATKAGESADAEGSITIAIEKAAQDISYETTTVDKYVYSGNFINELTQEAVYGAITYATSDETVATVDENGEVTIRGAGTATITATAAGNDNYETDTASYVLNVKEADIDSEIDVDGETAEWDGSSDEWIDDVTYDGEPIELSMVLDLTDEEQAEVKAISYQWYTVAEDGTATPINGANESSYTLEGDAVNAGDYVYKCEAVISFNNGHEHTVTSSPIEVSIAKAEQEISYEESPVAKMVGDDPFTNTLTRTKVDSNATISYTSEDVAVATVDPASGEVTIVGVGTTTITATVSETTNYKGATASYELNVDPPEAPTIGAVTITSDLDDNTKTYDGEGVTLTADVQDVAPVSAEVTYQWYTVAEDGTETEIDGETGSELKLAGGVSDTGTYKCVVTATTLAEYGSASKEAAITITIRQAEQVIGFTEESVTKPVGEVYKNELTSDSVVFGAITYESDDESVATVDADGSVTIVGVGSATITATAEGSNNYTEASGSYTITGTDEGLSVEVRSDVDGNEKTYDAAPVTLTAEASSSVAGATFTYQWYRDGGEMDGETDETLALAGDVSDSGSYLCEVTVTYPNDVTDTVTSDAVTITITAAAQEISFAEPEVTMAVGDAPFTNELIETTVDTAGGAVISYESSDETIATVDADGQVTILAEGNVTITAAVSATANYAEASASYDLTIEAAREPAVDKTALEEAIDTAQSLTASDYTEDSWSALEEVLAAAEAVAADPEAQQAEVDAAVEALETAMGSLEAVPADKEALEEEIAAAEDLVESDYTSDSWAALQDALAAAEAANADPDALQSEVEAAMEALETAMDNLEAFPVDKRVLEETIETAQGLTASNYTADSWSALEEALAAAEAVYADDDATQSAVKQAEIDLIEAIASLEGAGEQADKAALMEEYVNALDLSESDYTPESWTPFAEALANALEVLLKENATQDDIDAAAQALQTARGNLVKKPAESGTYKDGLLKDDDGIWRLYKDNVFQENYTGYAENKNGKWYVVDGCVLFDVTNILKDKTGAIGNTGTWYYVIDSKVQDNFTGLSNFRNENGWWYIDHGKVDFTRNSVDKNVNGWWYVVGGKAQLDFTGLANYKNENGWWYIENGRVNFNHNGVDKNKNGWWYVTDSKVQFGYTGVANYKNQYGWWYINAGKVDFTYNGRASNKYGTWNIVNGKVVF